MNDKLKNTLAYVGLLFILLFIFAAINGIFFKKQPQDCAKIAKSALKYYEKEIKPLKNTNGSIEYVIKLNNYLNQSKEFYLCVQNNNNIK